MKTRWPLALGAAAILAVGVTALTVTADAQQGQGWERMSRSDGQHRMMRRMSPEDRAAFLDARIAALKAGLRLTPDQEKLWPAVETAMRDSAKTMREQREKRMAEGRPDNPVAGLRRMADAATQRGAALGKLADAAEPLYATLSEEQKGRLPALMRPMSRMAGPGQMRNWRGHGPGGYGPGGPGGQDSPYAGPRRRGPPGQGPSDL